MSVFNHTESSRIQLRGRGELQFPAKCMVCGSGNCDDGYIDFGVWYEFEGTIYMCMDCIHQAAEVAGCLLPVQAITLKAAVERIGDERNEAVAELEVLRERLAVFDAAVRSVSSSVSISDSIPNSSVNSGNDSTASSDGSIQPAITAGESESEESIKIPGQSDISESSKSDGKPAGRAVQFNL